MSAALDRHPAELRELVDRGRPAEPAEPDSEDPGRPEGWYADGDPGRPAHMVFEPGDGFWVHNLGERPARVFLGGALLTDSVASLWLLPGLNLFGTPFAGDTVPALGAEEDAILTAAGTALEAGADDVRDEDDQWMVVCDPTSFVEVKEALEATEGLPNRQNDFARWDAWDYAIVMEGWYKAVISSNNQNTPQAWAENAKKSDRDIILTSDYVQNTMTAIVSKEALGNPSEQDILNWDIIVVMTSHDGHSDDNNFGDTRWVNASVSEWQFGGGQDSDRDPNIIDVATSPGLGRKPGRSQSEMLDYKSPEAVARLENGLTACVLEATAFEDQGPPVITVEGLEDETIPFLANAPLYFPTIISDDDEVKEATLYWRADSVLAERWMGEVAMGYSGEDVWSVDLPVDEITSEVPMAPEDSTRNIEFMIEASDPSGNVSTTPIYTMEIFQPVYEGRLDGFVKAMKGLQTLLGDIHDCDVWVEHLETFLGEERERTVVYYGHARPLRTLKVGLDFLQEEKLRIAV